MFDKPNIVIPLAASYNTRGIAGFTNAITNDIDQIKINSMYEPVKNALTGKTTLYLVKRPGVTISADSYGTTGQVAYLAAIKPGAATPGETWVFSTSGNDVRASDTSSTNVIATAANYYPAYSDRTSISGTDTAVVHLRSSANNALTTTWFASAINSWTQITDSDYTGLTIRGKPELMDGYMFALDSANKIFNSDLNSLANWTASSYITKQIVQDVPTGLARLGKMIIAFGTNTMELFVNAGNPTGSPLQAYPQGFQRYGLPDPSTTGKTHYYATIGGRIYFEGRTGKSQLSDSAFSFDGQRVEKISTTAIDKIISERTIYSVNAITFLGHEAVAFAMDLTTASTQRWLMFFPSLNEWFEWNSTVFTPVNSGTNFLGVGSNQHRVYNIPSTDNWQDSGTDFTWTHQFQLPSDGNQRKFMPYIGLKGDTARSAQAITVEKSDDDYQTFQTLGTIDMTGKQKRLVRCGSYEGARVIRLSHSGNTEVRLSQFLSRIT